MKIGKNIIEIRKAHKYTEEFMANELKISVDEYKSIENDDVDITLSMLDTICGILSLTPAELLQLNEPTNGIKNYFFNHSDNSGTNIKIQGIDQKEVRKAYKELYSEELKRIPKLEKLLRENNIPIDF
ncbi:helix-turn-helix transcriptional regulator [Olivibacter sp. CPCC 100613]|uniref:helix-turn-helix domain-containing protein n=1 Tax=Olivibacter sp. CPCC 100613 TaxID=3079931 RepID=UPI002FFAADB4